MQTEMTAKNRIQQAMAHIQEAESLLEMAALELAGVRGMNSECDRMMTLRDQVKSSWNLLENTLQRGLPEETQVPPASQL